MLTFEFCYDKMYLLEYVLWIWVAQRAVVLVKNGEHCHKVPAKHSEQARGEICRLASDIRSASDICLGQVIFAVSE